MYIYVYMIVAIGFMQVVSKGQQTSICREQKILLCLCLFRGAPNNTPTRSRVKSRLLYAAYIPIEVTRAPRARRWTFVYGFPHTRQRYIACTIRRGVLGAARCICVHNHHRMLFMVVAYYYTTGEIHINTWSLSRFTGRRIYSFMLGRFSLVVFLRLVSLAREQNSNICSSVLHVVCLW